MSTTSGPSVPDSTGSSMGGVPSLKLKMALRFCSIGFSFILILDCKTASELSGPQQGKNPAAAGTGRPCPVIHHVPQLRIRAFQHALEDLPLLGRQRGITLFQKPAQQQVEFQHAAPAAPAQAVHLGHTVRLANKALMFPMARVGFSPLGHTSTQFMMPWQRYRR